MFDFPQHKLKSNAANADKSGMSNARNSIIGLRSIAFATVAGFLFSALYAFCI